MFAWLPLLARWFLTFQVRFLFSVDTLTPGWLDVNPSESEHLLSGCISEYMFIYDCVPLCGCFHVFLNWSCFGDLDNAYKWKLILVQNWKDCSWFPGFLRVCVCVCVCVEVGGMVGYEEQEVIILDKLENLNHVVSVEDSQNFLVHMVLFYRKLLL